MLDEASQYNKTNLTVSRDSFPATIAFLPSTEPGEPGAIVFYFSVGRKLEIGDEVYVSLPGFKRQCLIPSHPNPNPCQHLQNLSIPASLYDVFSINLGTQPDYTRVHTGPKRNASIFWSDEHESLRILMRERIRPNEELKMEVRSGCVASGCFRLAVPALSEACEGQIEHPTCVHAPGSNCTTLHISITVQNCTNLPIFDFVQVWEAKSGLAIQPNNFSVNGEPSSMDWDIRVSETLLCSCEKMTLRPFSGCAQNCRRAEMVLTAMQ